MVICIGEVLFDLISDQPGAALEDVTVWISYPGGAPANVACGVRRLGIESAFIGAIGDDPLGSQLVDTLQSNGVDRTGIQRIVGSPTRSVLVTRDRSGDRTFAAFGENRSSECFADTRLDAKKLPLELLRSASYLVTGTLGLASSDTAEAIHRSIDIVKKTGGIIVTDLNWRSVFWPDLKAAQVPIHEILTKTDILKLTDDEAELFFGTVDPVAIHDRFPYLNAILLTRGDRGCAYWIAGHSGECPAFQVSVEDTTGAGDAFLAGFLYQHSKYSSSTPLTDAASIQSVIRYASAAGALTTLKRGAIAALPTSAEIEAFLNLAPVPPSL